MTTSLFTQPLTDKTGIAPCKWYLYDLLGYQPHEGQFAFHHARERFKVLIAGARFGKSLAAVREILPWLLLSNTRGWIVGPTYRLAEKEMRYLLADMQALGTPAKRMIFGGASGASSFETAWGAEAHALSAVHEHTLFGEEVDWMLLSEAAQLRGELFSRVLRGRLATRKGILVLPTTPKGFNWVHELYQRGQTQDEFPDWRSFLYKTADNPLIDEAEVEEARRTLPREDFAEQFEGAFTTRRGLVYPEFSAKHHVATTPLDLAGLACVGGMDFGYSNPTALIFGARLNDGRLYIYDEYYVRERTISGHLAALSGRLRGELEMIYADPSGSGAIAEFHQQGINIQRGHNSVLAGIDRLRQMLIAGKLLVDRRCENLLREFGRYSWAEDSGQGRELAPLKTEDHALDALRYLVMGLAARDSSMMLR